jgi:DHA2 family multidrug resistance protein-like MFS transporter
MNRTAQASRATSREWIGLGVLALACLLYVMDLTVLDLAIPAITADLRPTSAQLLWIIDVYGFMVAGARSRWARSGTGSAAGGCS